jgi:predicted RNA-binding Zn-ribbon protein involved in translation (DUF1610 family)
MGRFLSYLHFYYDSHAQYAWRDRTVLGRVLFCWEWLILPVLVLIWIYMAASYAVDRRNKSPFGYEEWMEKRVPREDLKCLNCGFQHIDSDKWARKPHKTHLCLQCGHLFEGTKKAVSNPKF